MLKKCAGFTLEPREDNTENGVTGVCIKLGFISPKFFSLLSFKATGGML